ncbi:hypothetical protein [Borreliella carolinensis]|uniref:Uncharacterized protein n=1 Tax=Borreliella carolinensis TaxID=478174 RepID=A0ABY9E6B6_9SPIR|nr:hypothetical protein [Borreliella carolinensis]WKC90738.1 hypothetical protein QIA18_02035 [Borreliella carolinensis]WNY67672.1 hypothetical protein QIA42_01720 [Borreliella carolinensis]
MNLGLFDFILSMFSINKELTSEQIKQKRLKEVKVNLSRVSNFFNASKIQALPQFSRFLYNFYKIFSPLRPFAQRYKNSNKIVHFVVEKYLNENQKKSLDYIYSFSASDNINFASDLPKNLHNNLSYLFKNITQEQIKLIDETYEALNNFFDLVLYQYHLVLKNFDNLLPEDDFVYRPRFSSIGCGVIIDDLKDLLECISCIKNISIWKNLYDIILEIYGNKEDFPIKSNAWIKIISSILDINKSKEILYLIRYVSGDPDYFPVSVGQKPNPMARMFFNDLTKHVANEIEKVKVLQKNSKSKILAEQLFPGISFLNLDNYTEKMNEKILSKIMSTTGYIYCELLVYLKTYTIYFVKKELNDIINLLIIKGQWKLIELSREMSNDMHALINIYASLIDFDSNLGEHGGYGNRINALLHRASLGDKSSEKLLLNIIADVNKKAFVISNEYYSKIYSIEQRLQDCLSDYSKVSLERELIYNWKELDMDLAKSYGNNLNFGGIMKNILGSLALFLKLMDLYLEKKS